MQSPAHERPLWSANETNAIREPSGDHSGEIPAGPSALWADRSAFATTSRACSTLPPEIRANTIFVPSGDHAGVRSSGPAVSASTCPDAVSTVASDAVEPATRTKAIRAPSGDHDGSTSKGPLVNGTASPPADPMT